MQQLFLMGPDASALANELFAALNVRPAGYTLLPFAVEGALRGEALHLLPPAAPIENDVPCRVLLRPEDWAVVPRALNEIAAPALQRLKALPLPILLGGVDAEMLTCAAFREAVVALLTGPHPVIVVTDARSEETLRALTPAEDQLWLPVPQDKEGRAALLERLLPEAAMRM